MSRELTTILMMFLFIAYDLVLSLERHPLLLYSSNGKTFSASLVFTLNNNTFQIENVSLFNENDALIGMDYSANQNILIYKSSFSGNLYMTGISRKSTVDQKLFRSGDHGNNVAIDWIHNLIYFNYDNDIHVMNISNQNQGRIVARSELYADIAVNPLKPVIVWCKLRPNPAIIKSSQDGSNRKVLVSDDQVLPFSLAIDVKTDTIFYLDQTAHSNDNLLMSINFDGTERKLIYRYQYPRQDVFEHFSQNLVFDVYNSDALIYDSKNEQFLMLNSNGTLIGNNVSVNKLGIVNTLKIIHASLQPTARNKCLDSGCAQLCLPNEVSFTCVCPDKHYLLEGEICESNTTDFARIIYIKHTEHNSVVLVSQLDSNHQSVSNSESTVLDTYNITGSTSLDIEVRTKDANNYDELDLISSYSGEPLVISRKTSESRQMKLIEQRNNLYIKLAFDWNYKFLFFSFDNQLVIVDIEKPHLVYPISNLTTGFYIYDICANPIDLFVVWSELPLKSGKYYSGHIFKSRYDGSNHRSLLNATNYGPSCLAIDFLAKRIYWIDGLNNQLVSIDYYGSDKQTIYTSATYLRLGCMNMDVYSGHIYWSHLNFADIIHRIRVSGELSAINFSDATIAFKIMHTSRQPIVTKNLCANKNCTHLCVARDNDSYRCMCPDITDLYNSSELCYDYVGIVKQSSIKSNLNVRAQHQLNTANMVFAIVLSVLFGLVIILGSTIVYQKYFKTKPTVVSDTNSGNKIDAEYDSYADNSVADNVYEPVNYTDIQLQECYDNNTEPVIYVEIFEK